MHLALEVPNNYPILKSLEMLEEKTFDILIVRGAAGSSGFKKTSSSKRADRSRRSWCWNVGNVGLFLAGIWFKAVLGCKGNVWEVAFSQLFQSFPHGLGSVGRGCSGVEWSHNPWNYAQNEGMRAWFSAGWWLDLVISGDFSNLNNSMVRNAQFKEFEFWEQSKLKTRTFPLPGGFVPSSALLFPAWWKSGRSQGILGTSPRAMVWFGLEEPQISSSSNPLLLARNSFGPNLEVLPPFLTLELLFHRSSQQRKVTLTPLPDFVHS